MTPPPTTTYCARLGSSPAPDDEAVPARAAAGLMAEKSSDMGAPCHGLNGCSIARAATPEEVVCLSPRHGAGSGTRPSSGARAQCRWRLPPAVDLVAGIRSRA